MREYQESQIDALKNSQGGQNQSQMSGMSPEQMRQIAAEESQKIIQQKVQEHEDQVRQANWASLSGKFVQALEPEFKKDPEWAKKAMPLAEQMAHYDGVMHLLVNSGDPLGNFKELVDEPDKLLRIHNALRENPAMGEIVFNRLNQSVQMNKQAAQSNPLDTPLEQIKPSNLGMSNGKRTIDDWRSDASLAG